ncbi:MAG TPA: hypothetical protein VM406_15730 [Noviherbaspirillum sp.]|nr:hypothetical protein [Noviherbaspirillum sp.]
MQPLQVKDEFPGIAQRVEEVTHMCQITSGLPDELRSVLDELAQETRHAKAMLREEETGNRIIQCIDRLEKLSDRAMQACSQDSSIDQRLQNAVRHAHDALSDLKHRLH